MGRVITVADILTKKDPAKYEALIRTKAAQADAKKEMEMKNKLLDELKKANVDLKAKIGEYQAEIDECITTIKKFEKELKASPSKKEKEEIDVLNTKVAELVAEIEEKDSIIKAYEDLDVEKAEKEKDKKKKKE